MQIRTERPGDARAISQLTLDAFATVPYGDGTEPRIIEALRQAKALTLSIVAVDARAVIVGHAAFSPVQIDRSPGRWYGLGPISVAPHLQRTGIGSALIREGIDRLAALGAEGCALLGDPAYYGRFGFVSDPALTYRQTPSPYFQRLVLKGEPPAGDVTFDPAFDVS